MKRIALADCNNFFVSCERVFDPKLIGKPVVVLSSNDACVIARSNEAKKLGIKMGEPAFKCAETLKKHKVFVYSSNFPLYGDMSARVMQTLSNYASDIELYSVDEAFLYFPTAIAFETPQEESAWYMHYAQLVRKQVVQNTGIPISIGVGPTKTLAKIANSLAKKNSAYNHVLDLTNHVHLDDILRTIEVGDIWGIGYRYADFLKRHSITTAYDLKQCDDAWVRKHLTINGLKTVLELRGMSCLSLQDLPEKKKSITVSRAFGKNVTSLCDLKEAIACHITTAAEKLRKQKTSTAAITVFVCFTHYYDANRFYHSSTITLPIATTYTPELISQATRCLEKLFKKGLVYKKVGIILSDFCSSSCIQLNTFATLPNTSKQSNIMKTIDTINAKMGRNKMFFAAAGTTHSWQTKRAKKSASYTTNWHELLTIHI